MGIKFEKWHGLGNDFIILFDDIVTSDLAIKMCDRNFGIGADGLMCPTQSSNEADISWKLFNSDGTIARMCGNGIRCFAKFLKKHNLVNKNNIQIETLSGNISLMVSDTGNVLVDLGKPIFEPDLIPVDAQDSLDVVVQGYNATALSFGNPHCVVFCEEDCEIQARAFGSFIEVDSIFPQKTNVEFVNIISPNRIKLCAWERGVGVTLASGTSAAAAVVAGVKHQKVARICDVVQQGGVLSVEYCEDGNVRIQGDAKCVFEGEFLLES